ncbi:MAG: acyl transferase/acyl hydrolase/lysophospholipase [Benjaminiella poitrasii]|nr:MAG: acyl transferase/acyl hydrolase/lysophospholipase [Benjaminiella poitrasii]
MFRLINQRLASTSKTVPCIRKCTLCSTHSVQKQKKTISLLSKSPFLWTSRLFLSKSDKDDDDQSNAFITFLMSNKTWLENKLPDWPELPSLAETLNVDAINSRMTELYPQFSSQMKQLREGYAKLWDYLTMEEFRKIVEEIENDENDPHVHPEIEKDASVREGIELPSEEQEFIKARKRWQRIAFARFIGEDPDKVDERDIPVVGLAASGGGYRAMIGLAGYMKAMKASGAFDCLMYFTGISGSCWTMALYYNPLTETSLHRMVDHLRSHVQTHWANMSNFIALLTASPQNSKLLLQGAIQRYHQQKGNLSFADIFGVLMGGSLLTHWPTKPDTKDETNEQDSMKEMDSGEILHLSSQSSYLKEGAEPMPIYCVVRHDISYGKTFEERIQELKEKLGNSNDDGRHEEEEGHLEEKKNDIEQQQTDTYQWFEFTPYEVGCEEVEAWVPTWAFGRPFENGKNTKKSPEQTLDILMGMFGSAFAASLVHFYQEVRSFLPSGSLSKIDESIARYEASISSYHPISPSSFPNPFYKLKEKIISEENTTGKDENKISVKRPDAVIDSKELYLMDAGMDNNIPFYPLLRDGRDVDVILAVDLSADIQTSNHFDRTESYIKRRGIEGWPRGAGWPKKNDESKEKYALGTCTIFDSESKEEITTTSETKKQVKKGKHPIIVAYFPFILNKSFDPDFDPQEADFCSTWNFVYNPDQFKKVVGLAEANWNENVDTIRQVLKKTWQRKKSERLGEK